MVKEDLYRGITAMTTFTFQKLKLWVITNKLQIK